MPCVLVVDDDDDVRIMLKTMLERNNYDVIIAQNGNEATRLLKNNPVDLIITDLVMPEKEGIETIIEVKHDFPHIKIIAISGGKRIGLSTQLKSANLLGADRTLKKPFKSKELLNTVRELINI